MYKIRTYLLLEKYAKKWIIDIVWSEHATNIGMRETCDSEVTHLKMTATWKQILYYYSSILIPGHMLCKSTPSCPLSGSR